MTPERYSRVKQIFYAVQEIETKKRAAFLAESCNGDDELRRAVAELLESSAKVEGFIEKAAYEVLSETLATEVPQISVTGKRIGSYKVAREINHGGMGTVYLAERDDDIYQKQVAIKIVRGGFDSEELRRRFYDERKILAGLDHPFIAKLLDGGTTEDGLPYYVMDFVEGVTLTEHCEQNNLSTNERLRLFRKVCEAVQYAHQNLVIHRDLKPTNILVTKDGKPQLLDFGIAKVFQDDEQREATRTNLRVMTPEYASPEQISGKVITTASDIYSLGVILYELLTGSRPFNFKTGSLEEIINVVTQGKPPKPSDAEILKNRKGVEEKSRNGDGKLSKQSNYPRLRFSSSQLKGDLDNIVLKSLRKEPERRYATVEQFSEDVRRHLEGLPVIARPDTFLYRSSKFVRRNKIGVTAAAGVLLLLMIGAIAIVRQTQIAGREARIAAEQRDKARREQVRAERINKFFQEMLAYANPSWYAPGNNKPSDLTVVTALDEAAQKIENDLNEEPEVKAEILLTIGDTYASVGKFEPSERALESALKLSPEVHGEDSVKFADILYFLANTKRALGKLAEALRLYEQANAIYARHPEKGNQFPYFLLDYAGTFSNSGNHAEAARMTAEVVKMLQQLKGVNHAAVAVARMNLAIAYHRWGDMDNALVEAQAAYDMMEPPTGLIVLTLGNIRLNKGDLDAAEPLLLEASERLEQESSFNRQTGALIGLAQLYQDRGDNRKAEIFFARAIDIDRRIYAPDNPTMLTHQIMQSLIQTRAGKTRQCEIVIRKAEKLMNEEQRKKLEGNWGECFFAQKRYAEAAPMMLKSYAAIKEQQHPASPSLKKARERLSKICFEIRGKGSDAALEESVCIEKFDF